MTARLPLQPWEEAAEIEEPDELAILRTTVEKKCQPGTALDEKGMRRLRDFSVRGFSYGDISPVLEDMNITCERSY